MITVPKKGTEVDVVVGGRLVRVRFDKAEYCTVKELWEGALTKATKVVYSFTVLPGKS